MIAMCFPKAPKMDPAVAEQQRQARQAEADRLQLEKKKQTQAQRRSVSTSGIRSLLGAGTPPGGYLE
jgi:hypothetical protein